MPEYPDVTIYMEALTERLAGRRLDRIRIASPNLLQTVDPPAAELEGRTVTGFRRLGKRIVFQLREARFAAVHLMIAGRFQWKEPGAKLARRLGLAAFDFEHGTLVLTEAGTRKRATLHLLRGEAARGMLDRGGLEVMEASPEAFREALLRENHTVKRSLTDPRLFSGIGNAYSDEILHRARLSPLTWTTRLGDGEIARLFTATREVLREWTDRLRAETAGEFPGKVTAFRPEMAVHGKYREPCPACGAPVQRIVYSGNETNYCPPCQTGGRLLADRAMSRLLRGDWPRSLEELEELKGRHGG